MGINSEIYLIGLAVLTFLIIVFLFIRKISNSGKLKVKIEEVPNSINQEALIQEKKQKTFNFEEEDTYETCMKKWESFKRSFKRVSSVDHFYPIKN